MVCVGVRLDGDTIADARVAVSAVSDRPLLLEDARSALVGAHAGERAAREAGAVAAAAVDPHGDQHASAAYRRNLAGALVERACLAACEGAEAA